MSIDEDPPSPVSPHADEPPAVASRPVDRYYSQIPPTQLTQTSEPEHNYHTDKSHKASSTSLFQKLSQAKNNVGWLGRRKSHDDKAQHRCRSWADLRAAFIDRHFKRPVDAKQGSASGASATPTDSDVEDVQHAEKSAQQSTDQRKFSWRSRGAVITLGALSLILIIVTVTLAVVLTRKNDNHREEKFINSGDAYRPPIQSPVNANDTALAFSLSTPPVRLGILTNFADPSIYYDDETRMWYAVASNDGCGIIDSPSDGPYSRPALFSRSHVQMATSHDFNSWTLLNYTDDPLPKPGEWVKKGQTSDPPSKAASDTNGKHPQAQSAGSQTGIVQPRSPTRSPLPSVEDLEVEVPRANVWAPEMLRNPNTNKFILYYSAACEDHNHHCVGAASATSPQGPYEALPSPLACPIEDGGAIDPAAFVDPDTNDIFVAYKVDGNSIGHGGECGNTDDPIVPTPIMLQRMADDGLTPAENVDPVQIMTNTEEDGPLVEAPSLVRVGAVYYLFFSSGCTRNRSYNVKYATADNVTGPYVRAPQPLFETGSYNLTAPGSVTVRRGVTSAGNAEVNSVYMDGWKIVLHSRVHVEMGGIRVFFTSGLLFDTQARTVKLVDGSAPT